LRLELEPFFNNGSQNPHDCQTLSAPMKRCYKGGFGDFSLSIALLILLRQRMKGDGHNRCGRKWQLWGRGRPLLLTFFASSPTLQ
jgi:hypothetical protein